MNQQQEQQGTQFKGPLQITSPVMKISHSSSEISLISETDRNRNHMLQSSRRLKDEQLFMNKSIYLKTRNEGNALIKTMRKANLVKKFKQNLLQRSYVLPFNMKHRLYQMFIKKDHNMSQSVSQFILPTQSTLLFFWDLFQILINFFLLWITPMMIAFHIQYTNFMYLITALLFIDFIINLNRSIIYKGQVIKHRNKIIKMYLKSRAIYDVLLIIFWIGFRYMQQFQGIFEIITLTVLFLSYTKIQYLILNHFESYYLKGATISNLLDLIALILYIYFYAHFIACVFHYAAQQTNHIGHTWLIKYEIQNESIWVRYNYAFYWATMTMTTVGYGDITAQNQIELIVASIIMFFSSCVFAYSMSSIGLILKNFQDAKLKQKLVLTQINNYMNKNSVDIHIQGRVRNYLHYYLDHDDKDNIEIINQTIDSLPSSLQDELRSDIQMKIISQIKLIILNFSKQTQISISQHLEQVKYAPKDVIYQKGKYDTHLYFVQDGEVELYDEASQMKLARLIKGNVFGQYQFFSGLQSKYSVRSLGFSEVYRISRTDFQEIIKNNRRDFESFHNIKDSLIFNSDYHLIDRKCNICSNYTHMEIDCPMLSYKPDVEQLIKKDSFHSQMNNRRQFHRKERGKISSKGIINDVSLQVNQLQQNEQMVSLQESVYESQDYIMLKRTSTLRRESFQQAIKKFESNVNINSTGTMERGENEKDMRDFEQVCTYSQYMAHNNVGAVIEKSMKKGFSRLHKFMVQASKYTFYYSVKFMALRMKQLRRKTQVVDQ